CFFFQAEDGIRDFHVTGVQTCALPIFLHQPPAIKKKFQPQGASLPKTRPSPQSVPVLPAPALLTFHLLRSTFYVLRSTFYFLPRSEERRVGKECRSRWPAYR